MKIKKRYWIPAIVIIIIVVVGIIIKQNQGEKKLSVTTEEVTRQSLVATVSASGKVEPVVQVKVSSQIPARITKLVVREGERVTAGQFLVELDKESYSAVLEQTQSARRAAQAQLDKARADFKRAGELVARGMISEAELDAARAQSQLMEAELDQMIAREKQSRDDLSKTVLSAPMSGIVSRLNKEEGEMTLGSTFQEDVIMIIADLSRMQIKAQVDENDIVGVKLGDTTRCEIDAFPDTVFVGAVAEIAQSAEITGYGTQEEATNFDVDIRILESISELRPGMSATVDIEIDRRDSVLAVPLQSVALRDRKEGKPVEIKEKAQRKSSRQRAEEVRSGTVADTGKVLRKEDLIEGVYVMRNDSAIWVPVKTGISSNTHIEVLSGLEGGEMVVTGPFKALAKDLTHGTQITTQEDKKKK
ncbi:efflux RND transporter periplasmic adaptor subunit [bacterium]|nr:efflux RND transporter periplasmic adaptor subunit [bacterium]